MRQRPAWLIAVPLLLSTAVPVRAGGVSCAAPAVVPGVWTPAFAPTAVRYDTDYPSHLESGHTYDVRTGRPYELTVDPFCAGRAFRIGTPAEAFTDRDVVQRTVDHGRHWETVYRGAAGFGAVHAYMPTRNRVYVAVDGTDGETDVAVLRSDDGGDSWYEANGGIEGEHAFSLSFAPSDPDTAYAVTLPCRNEPQPDLVPGCRKQGVNVAEFVGRVALWVTRDGGASWTPMPVIEPDRGRNEFAVRVDPSRPEAPYVYDKPDSPGGSGLTARVLIPQPSGQFAAQVTSALGWSRTFRAFRPQPHGQLRLLVRAYAGGEHVSADGGTTFVAAANPYRTERPPSEPGPSGDLFELRVHGTGSTGTAHDARAAWWSVDAPATVQVETGRFPSWLPPDGGYVFEPTQVAGDVFYVTIGRQCYSAGTHEGPVERCRPGAPEDYGRYEWVTWAYRIPAAAVGATATVAARHGQPTDAPRPLPTAPALVAGPACPLPGATGRSGLVFDGRHLVYPVDAGRPDAVAFARVDPARCTTAGSPVTVPLRAVDLATALERTERTHKPAVGTRTLAAANLAADTVTYDATSATYYFSLRDNAGGGTVAQGNPASVWAWPGTGAARLVYTGARCLTHNPPDSGMELLSWDTDGETLTTCADARPLPVDAGTGRPRTPWCLYQDAVRGYGYGWPVTSWTDLEGPRALLLVEAGGAEANVVTYNLEDCTAGPAYRAGAVGTAKGPGKYAQLACDAVSHPGTLLWHRTGTTATPYQLDGPDGGRWCRTPSTLHVTTGVQTCAVLSVRAPGAAPLAGRPVTMSVDGTDLPATTGRTGQACVRRTARHAAHAAFSGDAGYLASDGSWPPVAVPRPAVPRALPPRVVPPEAAAVEPPPPPVPAPAVPQPAPLVQLPVQAPAPGANVGALSDQREEQQQLAYVGEQAHDEEPAGEPVEELLATGLVMAAAVGVALRRRAAAATQSSGRR